MTERCSECGAILTDGTTCQSIFESFLALEYSDPAYYEAHFPMVAAFMIQHGRYSDEALVWALSSLRAHLDGDLNVPQLRQSTAKQMRSKRTWKVTRQPDARPLPSVVWSITIADVARDQRDAESYIRLVNQWADSTCKDGASLV